MMKDETKAKRALCGRGSSYLVRSKTMTKHLSLFIATVSLLSSTMAGANQSESPTADHVQVTETIRSFFAAERRTILTSFTLLPLPTSTHSMLEGVSPAMP